jgi:hypothetical protein
MAQQREDAEEIAVGFEGRHGGIGFSQRAGDRVGAVEQRQELRGLFREGLGRAEVRRQEDDHAALGAFRAGAGRPSVRGHAGQGTAWLGGHDAIEGVRLDASNPTPQFRTSSAISSQSSLIWAGFFTGRPASTNQ